MASLAHWFAGHWSWCSASAGTAVGVYATVLYIYGTVRADPASQDGPGNEPHRFTWFIFAVGSSGGAWFTYKAVGIPGCIGAIVIAVGVDVIWLLSLKKEYGYSGLESKWHPFLAAIAVTVYAVQIGWWHFPPLVAVMVAIGVDSTAIWVQWKKVRKDPTSEELAPWVWGTLEGLFAALPALAAGAFTAWGFPLYFLLTNAVVVYYLWQGGKQPQSNTPHPAGA